MKPRFRSLVPDVPMAWLKVHAAQLGAARPDDLSNKFESWGDCWSNFSWRNCFEISCLVQLCHLYCRGRLLKQSLNHFVLQSFEIILEVLPVWKANCGDASLGLRQQHWQHCGAEGECRKRRRAHRFYLWAHMKGIGTLKIYKNHRDSWHSQTVRVL